MRKLVHTVVFCAVICLCTSGFAQDNARIKHLYAVDSISLDDVEIGNENFLLLNRATQYFISSNDSCSANRGLSKIATTYYSYGFTDSATIKFIQATQFLSGSCPAEFHYYTYNKWTKMAMSRDEYQKADSLSDIALQAAKQLPDSTFLYNVLINKSIIYSYLDRIYEGIDTLKNIARRTYGTQYLYNYKLCLQNIGALYVDLKEYDSALYYLQLLEPIIDTAEMPYAGADYYNNIALVYNSLGRSEEAAKHFVIAIRLAERASYAEALILYYNNYSKLLYDKGNFELAFIYQDKHSTLLDSIYSIKRMQFIEEMETKYQMALQNQKIAEQELELRKKTLDRNKLFYASIILILILGGAVSRLIFVRRSKAILEKEKARSDELLLNILPQEVAEELKATGSSEARDFDNVTVLFSDIQAFTETAELLTAKELVSEINYCFKAFDGIIDKYKVEKIKTIGDAYMAAGGLPVPTDESVKNTVLAALEMQAFISKRKLENDAVEKPAFQMRIGIHTGPVVAGIVGVKKFQYDIWGDTVNTASRMESNGEVSKVNISQATYMRLKNDADFAFESRGKIEAKGKGEMEMWFVRKAYAEVISNKRAM